MIDSDPYQVKIRGTETDDDGLIIDLGPIDGKPWWQAPAPFCPDCGGALIPWQGSVPGARQCAGVAVGKDDFGEFLYSTAGGCGSLFMVEPRVVLMRLRIY